MGLDVDIPEAPTLEPPPGDEDDEYRRKDIQNHLEGGAWEEAFNQWKRETELQADAFEIARELELFEEFDFFWDQFAQRVGYSAPGIPDDWDRAGYHDELTSWRQASSINAGLAELGQLVCDILKEEYLEWEDEDWGDDLDLPSFE